MHPVTVHANILAGSSETSQEDPRMAERSAADDTTATTGHTPPWGEMELWREEQE